jgi:signal transduction histidine kinase
METSSLAAYWVRLIFILIATVCACLAGTNARALDLTRSITQFRHTAWTLRDGMPAFVGSLAQTPDGYLWIGAATGLYRFDGIHLEPFEQKIPGGAVITLAATASGDLWIGSSSGISLLRQGRLTSFDVPGLGRPSGIRHIALGLNGDIWIATDKVARFDGQRWQVMESDWGDSELYRKPGGVWGLAVAPDGVIWTKNLLGLYYLRPGTSRFVKADGYAGSIVDFARAADGRIWTADIATRRFYALPDLGLSGPPPPPAQVGAVVPEGVLGRVMFDHDGALWCANPVAGGLYRIRSATARDAETEMFTPADGQAIGIALRTFEDREGDVWVGTSTGLNRFAPANVVTESSVSIRARGADITASKGTVYVADGWPPPAPATGHSEQRIYAITDGAPRPLTIDIGDVMVLNAQGSDHPLLGSRQALLHLRDGVATTIELPKEAKGADLVSATQHGGDLWAVFGERGLFRRRDDVWTRVTAPGLATIPTTRMRVDRQGVVWLFDGDEIKRLTADRLEVYPAASGPDIGGTHAFIPDSRGVLLGGERGVSYFDGQVFHTLSRRQAPYLRSVIGIVADDLGGTWFHTSSGIYRVATQELDRAFRDPTILLDYQLFDERDGLSTTGTLDQFGGSAVRGPDGRLWFLNFDNLAWIDPHRLYRNPVPPPASIRSLTVDERSLDPSSVRKLSAGVSNLQIDYTALSLQNPDRLKFRYQLQGVDRTWIDAGDRRQAFYTRLSPGHYRFVVIAANNDGVWNPSGASLEFEIPPTFVQSGWFALLCALFAALSLWLVYSLRMRQVTAAFQNRLEARAAERERIARELHDTLLQGVQGLILKIQAATEEIPQDSPARKMMEDALDRADDVLIEGRDRVKDLRVSPATSPDLPTAIGLLGAELANEHSIHFNLSVEGKPRLLDPTVREETLRIAQEALANAFRHARATKIETEVIYHRAELRLRFRDDGCGIGAAILKMGRPDHWGLPGMRERAKKIRARFEVWSRPGAGTEIELSVPARIAYIRSGRRRAWWPRGAASVER